MTYKIIATGSKGNAYLVHDGILIDVGVSYKTLALHLKKVKVILLTHIHGDHFKGDVIARISQERPDITFICGSWLEDNLKRLNVSNYKIAELNGKWIQIDDYLIYPIELEHGDRNGVVQNYGWRIMHNGVKVIHMTDTGSYDGINAKGYDIIALEANHDLMYLNDRLEQANIEGRFEHGYYSKKYHAANHKALQFVEANKSENTEIRFLHGSETYGGLK